MTDKLTKNREPEKADGVRRVSYESQFTPPDATQLDRRVESRRAV